MKKLLLSAFVSIVAYTFSFGQTTVRGKITDENGEAAIGATIRLKLLPSIGAVTGLDGDYSFKIPDSTVQTLIVSYMGYDTIETIVQPVPGEVIIKDFGLVPSVSNVIKEVEITAKAVKAKEYYMEKVKMNAATTIDYISSETMKKTGDANVVAAVARVSGVSTNGGFITVRGIGDRYVKTTINGSRIPTLDPFTNNIKLDMFPASLVDNIIITKTASSDLPGDWAGAYLSVETKDYPEKLSVNVESTVGYNNQSTFKDVLTSQRSTSDWLGYDKNFRDHDHTTFVSANMNPTKYEELVALGLGNYYNELGVTQQSWNENPDTYYKLGLVELGLLAPAQFDDAAAVSAAKAQYESGSYHAEAFKVINAGVPSSGKSFPNNWNTLYRKAPLNFSQSFSIGNQTKLLGKPLGFITGFRYGSSIAYDPNASANKATITDLNNSGVKSLIYQATEEASKETNGWSALANLAYKLNSNTNISFLFMPNFTGANNVRYTVDAADPNEFNINKTQFYEQRKQLVYQFRSEHYMPGTKLKLELNASYTDGKSIAPDFKKLAYSKSTTSESYGIGQGMNRSYRYLSENIFDSRLSAELPIGNKPGLLRKLKFGGSYQDNHRDSEQHDYTTRYGPYAKVTLENGAIDSFLSLDKFEISSGVLNGTPYSTIDIYYMKSAYPADHTIGYSKVKAGFAMIDYSLVPVLRFAGGLRVEQAEIFTDAFKYDSLGLSADDPRRYEPGTILAVRPGNLNELSYLPSANIIWKLKNDEASPINLRLNYSQTVARPSIRELTDVVVSDYELRTIVFGNSNLKMVRINNYDLRLESYFKSGDNLSLSLFYKDFKNHIEISDAPMSGYTWMNVDKSRVQGIELEGRKILTKHFDLRANVTWVNSRSTFMQERLQINNGIKEYIPVGMVTRTMFGQAPYVINGILAYTADSLGLSVALSYNVQGPRLVLSSFHKQLEVYELHRHLLDIKVTKTLGKYFIASVTVRDILNAPIRRTYNYDEGWIADYDKYRFGTNYVFGISYKL